VFDYIFGYRSLRLSIQSGFQVSLIDDFKGSEWNGYFADEWQRMEVFVCLES
jgi:hypothetical protein